MTAGFVPAPRPGQFTVATWQQPAPAIQLAVRHGHRSRRLPGTSWQEVEALQGRCEGSFRRTHWHHGKLAAKSASGLLELATGIEPA
jgi:hypothetical protein